MDPQKLQRIRDFLLKRRKTLLAAYERRKEAAEAASSSEPRDEADESVRLEAQDEAWRTAENESREVVRIDAALARMREETYGECVDCGDEIEEKRLMALPTAARCMTCQEAREPAHAAPSL
jgi:DnaK suppressor protein